MTSVDPLSPTRPYFGFSGGAATFSLALQRDLRSVLALLFYAFMVVVLLALGSYTNADTSLIASEDEGSTITTRTLATFVSVSVATLVLKQLQFPIVTLSITDPLARKSRLALLDFTKSRSRTWISRQSGADVCRKLEEMVSSVTMPLNRLSWLIPMSTQAVTAGLAALYFDGEARADLVLAMSLIVAVQLFEVSRTGARSDRRKEVGESSSVTVSSSSDL